MAIVRPWHTSGRGALLACGVSLTKPKTLMHGHTPHRLLVPGTAARSSASQREQASRKPMSLVPTMTTATSGRLRRGSSPFSSCHHRLADWSPALARTGRAAAVCRKGHCSTSAERSDSRSLAAAASDRE